MTLGDQKKLLGTTNLLWSSLDCALLWYKNNFADLLWRIWVLRPRERHRERDTHTHTHTHTQLFKGKEKKQERRRLAERAGVWLCLLQRYEKKNPTTTITTPQLEKTVFLWFFLPLLHLCFWVLIYLFIFCGGRRVWKSCLLGGQFLLNRLLLVFVEKQDIQNFRISILELRSVHSCFLLCCVAFCFIPAASRVGGFCFWVVSVLCFVRVSVFFVLKIVQQFYISWNPRKPSSGREKFLLCLSQKDFGFWLDDALLFIKRVLELCGIVFLMKLSQPLRFFNATRCNKSLPCLYLSFVLSSGVW